MNDIIYETILIELLNLIQEEKNKKLNKKVAKSWIKGTKTFADKVKKAKKIGMENPEGFAAYMQKLATGHWPSEK